MKIIARSIVLSLFLALSSSFAQGLEIIPKPVSSAITDAKYIIEDGSLICISQKNNELERLAGELKNFLFRKTGLITIIKKNTSGKGIFLDLNDKKDLPADGYELAVENNFVRISASNTTGIFYGIQSLKEILKKDLNVFIPGCKISDYPAYAHRGFVFDASRHFQSLEFVKKIIDVMAQLKLNVFHWHLTDDEGWRIESKKYPALNKIGSYQDSLNSKQRNGYYSVKDIKEILKYAKERYIKVLPEVEMPGHSRAAMSSYPEMLCPTNAGGNTYCAGNKFSYEFMKNVLLEVADIFETDVIQVGGDERPKGIWEKCPVCQNMISSKGLANENMLQNYFMRDICDFLSSKGIKTIAWYENIQDGIPANQIVEAWHPGEAWESAKLGHNTINTDCVFTYFDYPNNEYEKKFKPKWMPILELEKVYSFHPTPDSLNENEKKYIIGSECALWTEIVFENDVQYQLFPRILAFAEDVWTPRKNKEYKDFVKRVYQLKPFFRSSGFEYDNGEMIINGK